MSRLLAQNRPEDIKRLRLTEPLDPQELKADGLAALERADGFVRSRPPEESGCLYCAPDRDGFVDPSEEGIGEVVPHYGRPGGVIPRVVGVVGNIP